MKKLRINYKILIIIISGFFLLSFNNSSRCLNSKNYNTFLYDNIIIDGDFTDWSGIPTLITDPLNDQGTAELDIMEISVANDADNIYIRAKGNTTGHFFDSGKVSFLFNLDGDPANGYSGSEIMIEGLNGYDNRAGFQSGGAIDLGLAYSQTFVGSEIEIEISINRNSVFGDGTDIFPTILSDFQLKIEVLNSSFSIGDDTNYTLYTFSSNTLSINDEIFSSIKFYPNPTKQKITLNNPNQIQLLEASIFDIKGALLINISLREIFKEKNIDISKLSNGSYFIIIKGENGQFSDKFIKQ